MSSDSSSFSEPETEEEEKSRNSIILTEEKEDPLKKNYYIKCISEILNEIIIECDREYLNKNQGK
jgi:hypothetical protein